MKVGIIVHSKTGNTLHVASKIREAVLASGYQAEILRIEAANDSEANPGAVRLISRPDIGSYDVVIFGAPVRGYRLSPIMDAYLQTLPSLREKVVFGFVTHFFQKDSMGGTQAISRMEELCKDKGITISKTSVVGWMNPFKRSKSVQYTVDAFSMLDI